MSGKDLGDTDDCGTGVSCVTPEETESRRNRLDGRLTKNFRRPSGSRGATTLLRRCTNPLTFPSVPSDGLPVHPGLGSSGGVVTSTETEI